MAGMTETLEVTELVEDTLRMNVEDFQRHAVRVVREYGPEVPAVTTEKHKVLQILVNLVSNARAACRDSGREDKQITVRVGYVEEKGNGRVRIDVIDNGVGILAENLGRIFTHGFTTKKEGHGFGMHSSMNAARELGGWLGVQSDGAGRGATFTLELPVGKVAG
jgi:signal transduction histidine kinase